MDSSSYFPGDDITHTRSELISVLLQRINPLQLDPFQAQCLSKRVDPSFLASPFFLENSDFIYFYTCFTRPEENRLFAVSRQPLVDFLHDRIHPERGQGLDLVITTESMDNFLICNHDGDMFFRTPSEWLARYSPLA